MAKFTKERIVCGGVGDTKPNSSFMHTVLEMELNPNSSSWNHSLLSLFLSLLLSVGEFCWLLLSLLPERRRLLLPFIRTLRYTCREKEKHNEGRMIRHAVTSSGNNSLHEVSAC